LDKLFAAAAVAGWSVIIVAITIGATISYHEHRTLDQYNAQAERRYNDSMKKLEKIEASIIKLKNRD